MAKYSYEFKKKVVEAYSKREGGYQYLANKDGVKSDRDVVKWVKSYKAFGDEGLLRSQQNKEHPYY